jgi:hypothetical protein
MIRSYAYFDHMCVFFLLRWNKPDWRKSIGVFDSREAVYDFMQAYDMDLLSDDFVIEVVTHYKDKGDVQ